MTVKNLCWIRRDLRLHDHHALSQALKNGDQTYIVFIFDEDILLKLPRKDRRVSFIMDSLIEMEKVLNKYGSSLIIRFGNPKTEILKLAQQFNINALYFNRDYEPYAKKRDESIARALLKNGVKVCSFKDHVFFEKNEILNGQGEMYKVFTPYKNKWLEKFREQECTVLNYECNLSKLAPYKNAKSVLTKDWYKALNFEKKEPPLPGGSRNGKKRLLNFKRYISNYKNAREIIGPHSTSNLSPYIRMGNISIRDMLRLAIEQIDPGHETWLNEIIWREFYQAILDERPDIVKHCFKREYDKIIWRGSRQHFLLWCRGQTGFPIIDAAMRCLNETGLMHNRLRMVVASFLIKTLLIDWRLGEHYFALKLLDYDLAANNGGWQWCASTGVDAQPYFRIFNPYNQSIKVDPTGAFIKKWCPELRFFKNKQIHFPHESELSDQIKAKCFIGEDYPSPIVSYKNQRKIALSMYKSIQ